MAAITGTKTYAGELAGDVRVLHLTATIGAASDTITLTAAAHGGVTSIVGIVGAVVTGGLDDKFTSIQASYSGLVITVVSLKATGAAADDFTGTTVAITLLVKTTA